MRLHVITLIERGAHSGCTPWLSLRERSTKTYPLTRIEHHALRGTCLVFLSPSPSAPYPPSPPHPRSPSCWKLKVEIRNLKVESWKLKAETWRLKVETSVEVKVSIEEIVSIEFNFQVWHVWIVYETSISKIEKAYDFTRQNRSGMNARCLNEAKGLGKEGKDSSECLVEDLSVPLLHTTILTFTLSHTFILTRSSIIESLW